MKRRVALLAVALLAVVGTLYFTGVIGCIPKTQIVARKVYQGAATQLAGVEEWPRWRGPRGDLISREVLPDAWPSGGPKVLWAADVGLGYSSPIAAGGRVYLFSMNEEKETLTAFDANSGRIVWSDAGGPGRTASYAGTRATPAIDGERIYTYGGLGELTCRNLADGKPVWKTNVLAETGASNIQWGMASSPLISGERVYVQSGSGGAIAVAVDKSTGRVVWKSEAIGVGGYAHPIVADVGGARQLIVFGGEAVWGMDPETGRTLWQYPWRTSYDVNASTPIDRDGKLFVTSEYDHGCALLEISPAGATKMWENEHILGKFQGAILDGDVLYANSSGTLVCVGWSDGALKWKAKASNLRLGAGGTIVRSGDKLLMMSERGRLSLVRATPEGVTLIGQASEVVDGSEVWATPLVYGGRVYVKGGQELLCLELGK